MRSGAGFDSTTQPDATVFLDRSQNIDFGIEKALNVAASVFYDVHGDTVGRRMMQRECVAFIAAPYGFGPSSKAVAISSHLPGSIDRVFFGDGPPLDMARRSNEFSSCLRLDFNLHESRAAELLSEYPVLVFVNSMRFLQASSRVCDAVIFVDTLAWLRKSWPLCSTSLSAYFAQRFFGHPFPMDLESMGNFRAVGAIVPKMLAAIGGDANRSAVSTRSPIVHCGGLFSPAMRNGADAEFIQHLFETLDKIQAPLRIILPQHLHGQFATNATKRVSLIECSPITVSEHILESAFALTTSGIEFTYESMLLGVPTLFLPPFNFTQYLQLEYHCHAFDGCVPFSLPNEQCQFALPSLDDATAALQTNGMLGEWDTQFDAIGHFLGQVVSEDGQAGLERLRHTQAEAVRKVGSDGAQTIAACVVRELSAQGRVECVSRNI